MLLPCVVAAAGGALAGLAGAATFVTQRRRKKHRQSDSYQCADTGRATAERVNEGSGAAAGARWRDGIVVALRHEEGVVCVRQTKAGPVVTLSEHFSDTDYPGRSMFLVRYMTDGQAHLLPLVAPGEALAATGDCKCPLELQRVRPKAHAQHWSQTSHGFLSAVHMPVHLGATSMQPVPVAKVAAWTSKMTQGSVLLRLKHSLEEQLAESTTTRRQLEKKMRQLAAQLEQKQEEHAATLAAAQQHAAQQAQSLQTLGVQLQAAQEDGVRVREELEAARSVVAESQAAHAREQERLQEHLSAARKQAGQQQVLISTLEQRLAASSETATAKDQQMAQLSQQLSNLQAAFDCVNATAAERHAELLQWKEKHGKLDTAMQAIKARMRMVSDGEQRVRHLQASGVLRQADLQQLKQRLQRLGNQLCDDVCVEGAGKGTGEGEGRQGGDDVVGAGGDQQLAGVLVGAGCNTPEGEVLTPGGSLAVDEAVEEVVRELQFESQYGSMEALLRSTSGFSTGSGSGKAESLAAWFGRSSKASMRSATADSAASSSGQSVGHQQQHLQQPGSKRERYVQSDGGVGASQQRPPTLIQTPGPASVTAAALTSGPSTLPSTLATASTPGAGRPWVRPLVIVPSDDDASVNLASARPMGLTARGERTATARGERVPGGVSTQQLQVTPRRQGLVAKGPCTPSSVHSNNEEYEILSEDKDCYDPGLSPSHHMPGNMLLAQLDHIKLLSSGKRLPRALRDDDEEEGAAS